MLLLITLLGITCLEGVTGYLSSPCLGRTFQYVVIQQVAQTLGRKTSCAGLFCCSTPEVEGRKSSLRSAGPNTPKPTYSDSNLFDQAAITIFRGALSRELEGASSSKTGYAGIIDMALTLNRRYAPDETRSKTQRILRSLFPDFIITLFPLMFALPFPAFSAKLNAWITSLACVWLMGKNQMFDLDPQELQAEDSSGDGKAQGVLIERCRFLEESGCASVCVNTCKVPTQEFFIKDMAIPLSIEPDYDTFECRFKFGKMPLPQDKDDTFRTGCFVQCPSAGALRLAHAVSSVHSSSPQFEALCDSIAVDKAEEAEAPAVPSGKVYVKKLTDKLRGDTPRSSHSSR